MELNYSLLPDKNKLLEFMDCMKSIHFPGCYKLCNSNCGIEHAKEIFLSDISDDINKCNAFFDKLTELKSSYEKDIEYFYESDPACDSKEEIVSCYPGFTAIFYYRIANILYRLSLKITARFISEEAHKNTGIDIHPGASIGEHFFIDHGTGIVIGETSVIGHHVKIYQGVTLGGISLSLGQKLKNVKRHPTVGNYVTIYAGASILGGDVVIGDNVTIGSNVFLTKSVESNTKVILREPELIIKQK